MSRVLTFNKLSERGTPLAIVIRRRENAQNRTGDSIFVCLLWTGHKVTFGILKGRLVCKLWYLKEPRLTNYRI